MPNEEANFCVGEDMVSIFASKLRQAVSESGSLLCVGLDPDPEKMPIDDIFTFCKQIVDTTANEVCAFKPNLAFFEASGLDGFKVLKDVVDYIHTAFPNKVVIGDGKRGDIDSSSARYAYSMFEILGFDATTVNGFGGHDSIKPFLDYSEKGVFIWCKSSNPDGYQFQGIYDSQQNRPTVFEEMAKMATAWNSNKNIGLVVGATFPKELAAVRHVAPDIPILVPGIGSQEGDLSNSLKAGVEKEFPNIFINSSRSIIYSSSDPNNYSHAAGQAAYKLKSDINKILTEISDSNFGMKA